MITVPDIGPRHVLLGNPTTALGAGMLDLSLVRRVGVKPSPQTKTGTTVTGAENHEGKFYLHTGLQIQLQVPRKVASDVRDFIEIVDANGDYLPLGSALPKITMAIVHPDDAAGGAAGASAKTRWIPSVRLSDISEEVHDANTPNQDDTNFVTLTFEAGYVATDQNGDAVPEEALPDFRGDRLGTHGMTWSLPAPYGPGA